MHDPAIAERQYLELTRSIVEEGEYVKPANEEGRYQRFSGVIECPIHDLHVPVLTTKFVAWKWAFREIMWFLQGTQNVQYLHDRKVTIWDTWADENGNVGPLYGYLMRNWPIESSLKHEHNGRTRIDQVAKVVKSLRERPEARSHVVSMWRPDLEPAQAIKPCPMMLQFYRVGDRVSLIVFQRSCDMFLGVPFNLAQYAFLTHVIARQIGCHAEHMTWHGADIHVYENHVDQLYQQYEQPVRQAPRLSFVRPLQTVRDVGDYEIPRDVYIEGYQPGPRLPADISAQGTPGQALAL